MKFGLESEKFIFNLKSSRPSKGVFSFLDALSDFQRHVGPSLGNRATNEFVLNMIEIGTKPSHSPMEVLKEYLFNYLLIQTVARREEVALVPMGSLPMNYVPHMTPKWAYYVQNSILAKKKQSSWMMEANSPLRAAGNCAGVHAHVEVETPHEFLFSNRELQDKFNMGIMLSPLIAFSSSPYFYGAHEAISMRGQKYYKEVYKNFDLNGGLPPVMESSIDVLKYVQLSVNTWMDYGTKLGFSRDDLNRLTSKKGANWNPIRWNKQWNTIELRCLDSDSIDLDASKFIWVSMAMNRLDLKGEALQCSVLKTSSKLDKDMIDDVFDVRGKKVSILPTYAIQEIFNRAVLRGTKDPLVERYLHRLSDFASYKLDQEYRWAFKILKRALDTHQTSAEVFLQKTKRKKNLSVTEAGKLVHFAVDRQDKIISAIEKFIPETFLLLEEMEPKL